MRDPAAAAGNGLASTDTEPQHDSPGHQNGTPAHALSELVQRVEADNARAQELIRQYAWRYRGPR